MMITVATMRAIPTATPTAITIFMVVPKMLCIKFHRIVEINNTAR